MNTNKLMSLLVLVLALGAAACNTVEGAGEDIQSVGNAIDDAAEDAR
jgi:predicted small secreted protein